VATRFSSTIVPSNGTDANFRAWVQFIEDTLVTTGGWVVTADTGQMTIATATAPALSNTKVGYRIYRMSDALQAAAPVFVRLDYGSSGAAATPGVWITIGQSTDGAGNITDVRYNGGGSATPNMSGGGNAVTAHNSYSSANTNRFSLGLFASTTTNRICFMSLERSKDENGADTSDGLILVTSSTGIATFSQYVKLSASQPPNDVCINCLLPSANPGTFGADVGVGVHIPFAGVAQYPATSIVVVRQADFAVEAGFSMTMYGSTVTFQHLNAAQNRFPNGSTTADANSRICIRFD